MTRPTAARLAVLLALLVGMLGCELSPPLQPLGASPSPGASTKPSATSAPSTGPTATPAPTPTPALKGIRGYVVDRSGLRLPGARVTLGAYSVLTAEAGGTAIDEQGQTVTLEAGEFILLSVPSGEQTLSLSYDDASRSVPVTVQATGMTRADGLYMPVDGPVSSGSRALVANTAMALLKVQKASADAQLVFTQEKVTLDFKAPPNGAGDQIGAFSLTYVQGEASLSQTVSRTVPKITVPPALGATRSGPATPGEFYILDTSAGLRTNWSFDQPDATLKLQFFNAEGGRPILDREGNPLVMRIPCLLVP